MGTYSNKYSILTSILGAFMVFVYAAVGIIFLFIPSFLESFTGYTRSLLGILLVLYSLYRIYRIFKTWRERNDED